jgi:hypothetical protein
MTSPHRFSVAISNSIDFTSVPSPRPGREPETLCTRQQVILEASFPIAPEKPQPLQSKGNHYFKISEQVTSPIKTPRARSTTNELAISHRLHIQS